MANNKRPSQRVRRCTIDGDYRYLLRIPALDAGKEVLCVLCNPSTADGMRDDPTTRNLRKWARGAGVGTIVVVNLYAVRASRPEALRPLTRARAIGPRNTHAIARAAATADEVIVGWGNPPKSRPREEFLRLTADVLALLHQRHAHVYCVGVTKYGHPCHPRVWYLTSDRQKRVFSESHAAGFGQTLPYGRGS